MWLQSADVVGISQALGHRGASTYFTVFRRTVDHNQAKLACMAKLSQGCRFANIGVFTEALFPTAITECARAHCHEHSFSVKTSRRSGHMLPSLLHDLVARPGRGTLNFRLSLNQAPLCVTTGSSKRAASHRKDQGPLPPVALPPVTTAKLAVEAPHQLPPKAAKSPRLTEPRQMTSSPRRHFASNYSSC